jgi:hypothetical protein
MVDTTVGRIFLVTSMNPTDTVSNHKEDFIPGAAAFTAAAADVKTEMN